jgi:hypothetical protein
MLKSRQWSEKMRLNLRLKWETFGKLGKIYGQDEQNEEKRKKMGETQNF